MGDALLSNIKLNAGFKASCRDIKTALLVFVSKLLPIDKTLYKGANIDDLVHYNRFNILSN